VVLSRAYRRFVYPPQARPLFDARPIEHPASQVNGELHPIWLFFELAVARHLQLVHYLDVMSVREFVGGSPRCNAKLGGRFSAYGNAGAVTGEPFGKDERGYTYKRWTLADKSAASSVILQNVRRGLTTEGMAAARNRAETLSGR